MIKANFKYDNQKIVDLEISGHANYQASGEDIVCAAVSTSIYVTVNALEKLNVLKYVEYEMKVGYFKLIVNKDDQTLNAMIENLEYTLNDLCNQYPKYIKIKKEG